MGKHTEGELALDVITPKVLAAITAAGRTGLTITEITEAVFPSTDDDAEKRNFTQRAYYALKQKLAAQVRAVGNQKFRRYVRAQFAHGRPDAQELGPRDRTRAHRAPAKEHPATPHKAPHAPIPRALITNTVAQYIIADIRKKLDELERVI